MAKRVYLNETIFWKQLRDSDADIKIMLSDRGPGKSFAVKDLVLDALPEERFCYLRRNDLETKAGVAAAYFADAPLMKKIQKMGYDGISDYRGEIYLGHTDPTGKRKTLQQDTFAGFICALVSERYYKSIAKYSESNVTNIIYEEFITDGLYLRDEPAKLESLWSTFSRNKTKVTMWLIGNTMSRVCPYFLHWGLRGVPRQREGTIDRYTHNVTVDDEEKTITIDVLVIPELLGQGTGWFSKKKATGTGWVTNSYPHLKKRVSEYNLMHTLFFNGDMYKFRCLFLQDPATGAAFWYIEPMTKDIPTDARVVATSYELIQGYLYGTVGLRPFIPEEKIAIDLLKNGHWCVSDNLTGDDFNTMMQNMARLK